MRFALHGTRPRPRPREAVVPMISVIFLLLIFFLMTASIASPPPFDMVLPEGVAGEEEAGRGDALYMDAAGRLAYGTERGRAALAAAAAGQDGPLDIRAHREARAADVAHVLSALRDLGVSDTRLVTERR